MFYARIQRLLTKLGYVFFAIGVISFVLKNRLPDYTEIDTELRSAPVQRPISSRNFTIEYKGKRYEVRPRATYELKGLVVSQNNPTGIGDIYHDSKSLDTKDFCVIWGHNIRSNDFKKVRFWSGSWTCYCQWEEVGLRFWVDELSNNHLITDDPAIREKIARTGIGDQVRLKGMLVDYSEIGGNAGWRNTSLVRDDTGNGACEVFFVKELDIIRSTNLIWRKGYQVGIIGLLIVVGFKFLLFMTIGTRPYSD